MILTTVVLTILCISNIAELALCLYIINNILKKHDKIHNHSPHLYTSHLNIVTDTEPAQATVSGMTDDELRLAREKFEADMKAFQDLMNYNADVAYGITPGE